MIGKPERAHGPRKVPTAGGSAASPARARSREPGLRGLRPAASRSDLRCFGFGF